MLAVEQFQKREHRCCLNSVLLPYEGTRRREIILGRCYSAIFVGIVNELEPRKQLSTAQGIRANVIYRDREGKEIARMFRALWWIDICHANDRASIRPGDKAEVALAWDMGIDGFSPSPWPSNYEPLTLEECCPIDLILLPDEGSRPLLALHFSADLRMEKTGDYNAVLIWPKKSKNERSKRVY